MSTMAGERGKVICFFVWVYPLSFCDFLVFTTCWFKEIMILFHCTTLMLRNLIIFFKGGQHGVYRIYSCISQPFMTKKPAQKFALDLYTSHIQRPDQAVREISITTAWSALGKPVIIVVDFHQFSVLSSSTKKCEINVKWFKRRSTGDYFYCVF